MYTNENVNLFRVLAWTVTLMAVITLLAGCGRAKMTVNNNGAVPVSISPANASQCPHGGSYVRVGSRSYVSCNGAPGTDGDDGAKGPKGDKGDSGSSISVIALCPGSTHYPDTFIEQALCIGGKLYGVYSDRGGYLTYLPPGNYSSNAVGSCCNFTVKPECKITH